VNVQYSRLAEKGLEAARKDIAVAPTHFQLYPSFPNPFNPETRIRYELGASGQVTLAVYDVSGKRICTLVTTQQGPGSYGVVWDGKDDSGKEVASGVYLVRLHVRSGEGMRGLYTETRRMVRIR
jgi:hypothetical protein